MTNLRAVLNSLDPKLYYLLVAGVTWLLIYLWRRISLASWNAVTQQKPFLQQLPALFLSALLAAAPKIGPGFLGHLSEILVAIVLSGGGAIGIHTALAASPLPYTGGLPPPPDPAKFPVPTTPATDQPVKP
jgi:hypothetical protein